MSKISILIVEDEGIVAYDLSNKVRQMGWREPYSSIDWEKHFPWLRCCHDDSKKTAANPPAISSYGPYRHENNRNLPTGDWRRKTADGC